MQIHKSVLLNVVMKPGTELSESEIGQINDSIHREFTVPPLSNGDLQDRLFFLLKEKDMILSMGALWKVEPVIFNNENFTIYGFLNIVSNVKKHGYGKQVVVSMKDYLVTRNKTGLGFTMPKNIGFYEKCGFTIEQNSSPRFVCMKNGEKTANQDGQVIFYIDSSDRLIKKVLLHPDKEVLLPTDQLW